MEKSKSLTEKLRPLSAEQRAERLAKEIWTGMYPVCCGPRTLALITSEINDAVKQAEREAVIHEFEGDDCTVARLEQEAYAKGYKAGAEAVRTEIATAMKMLPSDTTAGKEK